MGIEPTTSGLDLPLLCRLSIHSMFKVECYFVIIRKIGILLSKVSHLSADFFKINTPLHQQSFVLNCYCPFFDFLLLFLRVWDVRSGRSIHKLKGHKVMMYTKEPQAFLMTQASLFLCRNSTKKLHPDDVGSVDLCHHFGIFPSQTSSPLFFLFISQSGGCTQANSS